MWEGMPESTVESKLSTEGGFRYDEDDDVTGFSVALCAERAGWDDAGTGSVLYDRDGATATAIADVYDVAADRKGPPRNHSGHLVATWGGHLVSGYTQAAYRSAAERAATYETYRMHGASIGWEVRGGDLDNRAGHDTVRAKPVRIRMPEGEVVDGFFAGTSLLPDTEFRPTFALSKDGTEVTIGGGVEPGGYWLHSTRKGYDRDWSTNTSIDIDVSARGTAGAGVRALRLVPPGTTYLVQYVTPGAPVRSVLLPPGLWQVSATAGRLDVAAADTSDCASPL
jgi:hypothetical protein